jgi:hypothetical protein
MEDFGIKEQENKRRMQLARHFKDSDTENLSNTLQKGKAAQDGEERTWGGKKYKKQGSDWIPVTEGREKKDDKKGDDKKGAEDSTKPKQGSKPQENPVDNHEVAQMTHMKKVMESDPGKAYEIFQSLSPEAQGKVPQDVVNKLVESSHTSEDNAADKVFAKEASGSERIETDNVDTDKGYGIIELASDMITSDGYVDRKKIQADMKENGVTEADVLASWAEDFDPGEWTANEISDLMSAISESDEHDNVIEGKDGSLTFDTLDPESNSPKFKEGDSISHGGKEYTVGKEIGENIHSLDPKQDLKSLTDQKKKLEKRVDHLAGNVASTTANRKKLKEAAAKLGELKSQIEKLSGGDKKDKMKKALDILLMR